MLAGVVLTLSMTNFPSFDEKEDVVTQYLTQVKFVLKYQVCRPQVSFSSCQQNLIETFQIGGMIALITKTTLTFSSDLLNGQK